MKRVTTGMSALLLLAAATIFPVRAQDAATLAAARELSAIMTRDSMAQMTSAMNTQIWPSIEQSLGSKVDAATLAELRTEFEKSISAFVGEVVKSAPEVYARHFTAQELNDLTAFYKSPTGEKALREMPKVLADVGTLMAPRMQAFQSELNTRMRAILNKHGYKD